MSLKFTGMHQIINFTLCTWQVFLYITRLNKIQRTFDIHFFLGVSNIDFIYPDQVFACDPNRFPRGEWIQWLVTDIPGEKVSKGNVLYPFANFSNPSDKGS